MQDEADRRDDAVQALFDHLPMGVHTYRLDEEGRLIFSGANPAADRILGVENAEFLGKTIEEAFPPLAATEVPERYRRAAALGETWQTERVVYEDGGIAGAFEVHAFPIGSRRMAATFFDITERKRAEEALLESQALYRDLVETAQDLIWQCDAQGRYTFLNRAWEPVLGYPVEEMLGKRFSDFQTPEYAERDSREFARLLRGNEVRGLETVHRAKDGREVHLVFNARFVRGPGGEVAGTRGSAYDISERKRAEEEGRRNEARMASLYRISQHPVGDEQTFLDFALQEAVALTGSAAGHLHFYDEARHELTFSSCSRDARRECPVVGPKTCCELDRTALWAEAVRQRRPILANGVEQVHPTEREGCPEVRAPLRRFLAVPVVMEGAVVAVVGVDSKPADYTEADVLGLHLLMDSVWKMTQRARAERALRESEARLLMSQRVARIGHYVLDVAAGTWTSSAVLDDLFGIGPGYRRTVEGWLALVHPEQRTEVHEYLAREVLRERRPFQKEYRIVRASDGAERWVHGIGTLDAAPDGSLLRMFGTIQDITERKRLEEQLLHAQKLESLGVLAGGIAHDFNNILMSVIGNAGLALLRLNPESPAVENLRQIEVAAGRAADLARQMLAYSGKGKFVVEALDLNRLVEDMTHLLQVSISKKAVLRLDFARDLPAVEGDATQLRQILMNLVINASEAIGERSGVIAITTGCMECNRNYLSEVWLDENLPEGLYVSLEVADTGCGMDRGTLGRLFDPFFTTKFTGRGLGMAAVLGIVRGHRGAIKVYSEPGRGSTFRVLLPAASLSAGVLPPDPPQDRWSAAGDAVLLVDDEESVRAVGAEMLRALGCTVLTAADGREALECYAGRGDIRAVILDLTMPHLDGEQTFRELRMLDRGVRVILTSGYNEQDVTQRFSGKGLAGFIQKPYDLKGLRAVLRQALEGTSAPDPRARK